MRIILSLCLLSSMMLLSACNDTTDTDTIRPVRLSTAVEQSLVPSMTLAGEVRARVESRLAFRVPGKITQRRVDVGERVTQGQELAQLDPANETLQSEAAKARFKSATSEFKMATSEYQRFKELHQRGFISTNELERHRVAMDNAKALMALAESEASLAANQVGYTTLRADADGTIVALMADEGEFVGAGQPVFTLAHDGVRDVLVEVPEDALELVRHATASVSLWAQEGKHFPAKLRELSAAANPTTRTFSARYTFPSDKHSPLGRTATVTLKAASDNHAVSIPSTALIKWKDQSGVWLYNEDTATIHQVPVQLIHVDGNQLLVAGIKPGSRVASAGVHLLTEGQEVRPFETPAK